MSFVLTGYSEQGCQEFIIPETNGSNHRIILDQCIFGTVENVELYVDIVGKAWRFAGVSENCSASAKGLSPGQLIRSGSTIYLSAGTTQIVITAIEFTPDIGCLKKYSVEHASCVSIGTGSENDIIIENNPLVSRNHAALTFDSGYCTVTDYSSNGVFVNGRRVHKSQRLAYGDCVFLFGTQIIWLGNILAIGGKSGRTHCSLPKPNQQIGGIGNGPSKTPRIDKQYFRRSPRDLPQFFAEKIEIEAPPQPQKSAKRPLLLTVGPSLTMVLPMIVGTCIAVLGSRGSSTYLYTGIIIAALSAIIGTAWALINLKYSTRQELEAERVRVDKYKEYLTLVEQKILKYYTYNSQNLNYIYPDAARCAQYDQSSFELWNRNPSHKDFLYLRLGAGVRPFQCPIIVPQQKFSLTEDQLAAKPGELQSKYKTLKNVPLGIDLKGKTLVGVVGQSREKSAGILRDLVIQAAANICYTDLKMVFLFDGSVPSDQAMWSFARWLPHTWSVDHKIRYYATDETERSEVCFSLANTLRVRAETASGTGAEDKRPYYIVFVSAPELLEGMPVSKYLLDQNDGLGVTTILFAERIEQFPNRCVDIIQDCGDFSGIFNAELGIQAREHIEFDRIAADDAELFARRLSAIEVRESESGGEIPEFLSFLQLYHANSPQELNVTERWMKNRTYETLRVPIGQKAGGTVLNLDIHENYHGPHGLVAGTTGSGKSETLQTYILSLAVNFSPNDVAFFLIDFKGGGMANLFGDLPHTAGCISNLSGNQIHRAMVSIKSENRRRQRIFNEFAVNHIDQYTKLVKSGEAAAPIPHLFIIIDEFAELKRDEPDSMRELISVAQVGRSLGVHLILATQKPSGTVDDNIWSNTRFRLCLRVQDRQDSNDVLHKPDAAYLTQAGRCYLQVGSDELYELFQSAWSGAPYRDDPSGAKAELACLRSSTGQPAIAGNSQRAKRLEQGKLLWLTVLLSCAHSAAAQAGVSLDHAADDRTFLRCLYGNIKDAGYELAPNPVSTARILDFIYTCDQMRDAALTTDQVVLAAISDFRQRKKPLPEPKEQTQLTAVVSHLAQIASSALNDRTKFRLWLPILPREIFLFDFFREPAYDGEQWPRSPSVGSLSAPVGIYDDPENQSQDPLTINLGEVGNLAVCGATASGKSVFLQTLLYALVNKYAPEQLSIYALDYSNHMLEPFSQLPHVGGIVFDHDLDKTEKLFVLLANLMAERKRLFQGGSYAQYVKSSGWTAPYVVVVIDNYASFREKTDNKFEGDLITLSREGMNYGISLVITAGGFGTGELQNRIADNFRSVICLELGDHFKYAEVLRTRAIDVLPEANIKGRGLANVNGRVLEFQTALALPAVDDYDRGEKLRVCFSEMSRTWSGPCARKIPVIPSDPTWSDFLAYEDIGNTSRSAPGMLPFAWDAKDASIAAIALSKTYCWLITGRARTGKSNLLKVLASAAALIPSQRYIVDLSGNRLRAFAAQNQAAYVSDGMGIFELLKELVPVFKERNAKKQELAASGLDEADIYWKQSQFPPIYLFIDDLDEFMKVVYTPPEGVGAMSGFVENITEKGSLHNIYFIACLDCSSPGQSTGRKAFTNMTSYHTGIHLGGNPAGQRIFDFSSLPYSEQSKPVQPGIGLIPPGEYDSTVQKVVIPLVKG